MVVDFMIIQLSLDLVVSILWNKDGLIGCVAQKTDGLKDKRRYEISYLELVACYLCLSRN